MESEYYTVCQICSKIEKPTRWCWFVLILMLSYLLHLFASGEIVPVSQLSFNKAIKCISVHDSAYIRCLKARPNILDHLVRMEDIVADLLAPVRLDSVPLDVLYLLQLLLLSND